MRKIAQLVQISIVTNQGCINNNERALCIANALPTRRTPRKQSAMDNEPDECFTRRIWRDVKKPYYTNGLESSPKRVLDPNAMFTYAKYIKLYRT